MGDGLRWHSSHGEERTEQASSPMRHELSTMCSGPTCSAILLPSFPPHPRTPSHGEGSARTWSTRPSRDTDASVWSRWAVHDQNGYQTVVTPQHARRSSNPEEGRGGKEGDRTFRL